MKIFEVYIIGGGPAGSATAISMALQLNASETKHVKITQICGPTSTRNDIGETVPPIASDYLRKLGLAELINDKDHLPCPGSHSVWGDDIPGFNDFFFTPIGKGYHLNRSVFNSALIDAAQNVGVTVLKNSKLIEIESVDGGFNLNLEVEEKVSQKHADFVVDATGIQAKVARSLNVARNQYDAVISVCHIFDLPVKPKKAAHTLVCAVNKGWWYGTQLPNNKALISFCTDKQILKNDKITDPDQWFGLLEDSTWFYDKCCEQFGMELTLPNQVDTRVSPSVILSCVVGENWLAVGDAASSYDSMTSAGITKALEQGLEAGQAIFEVLTMQNKAAMKTYQLRVFAAFNQYLRLHQELYCSEKRFPESPFWHRREFKK